MSAPKQVGGQHTVYPRRGQADDHTELLAWEAELEAERAPIPRCTCFVPDGRGKLEYSAVPCDVHRAEDLAAIDRDGYDDKRETGAV